MYTGYRKLLYCRLQNIIMLLQHILPRPRTTPFPYTTLFRSHVRQPRDTARGSGLEVLLLGAPGHPQGRGHQERARFGREQGEGDRKKHTSELQSRFDLVCRLLLEKKNSEMLFDFLLLRFY